MTEPKDLAIRNSTAEFLIFQAQSKEDSIEVKYADGTVWLSQNMIAKLFDKSRSTITEHLSTIYSEGELDKNSTCRNFRQVQKEGNRNIERNVEFYNLDAIISVGYRVNSQRATQFRIWATNVLKEFAIKGYVLDKERLKNGSFLNKKYFDTLLEEIREIRASERNFYQKITDIYATSMDYDRNSKITKDFFATVQNKMHFAIHKHTAPELILKRADSKKDYMGLTTWKNAPTGKIIKSDVSIAKNYLKQDEIKALNRFVTMYLDFAEDQAARNIPLTMEDWAEKLNAFLKFNNREVLENPGKVTTEIAKEFAESEFEKYRIVQDQLFHSDFDKFSKKLLENRSDKKWQIQNI
ncbi:TPA: virulence RhuM family protein [Candidatus Woesearchaeota archaeon]|nr:virulence RhuM family protein [Candidatus Woesearchaeota archaeon]